MSEKRKYSFAEKMEMTHPNKMEVGRVYHILKVSDPYQYTNKKTGEVKIGITVTTDDGDYYLPDTVTQSMIEDNGFEDNRKLLLEMEYIRCRSFKSKYGTEGKSIEKATREQYENRAILGK